MYPKRISVRCAGLRSPPRREELIAKKDTPCIPAGRNASSVRVNVVSSWTTENRRECLPLWNLRRRPPPVGRRLSKYPRGILPIPPTFPDRRRPRVRFHPQGWSSPGNNRHLQRLRHRRLRELRRYSAVPTPNPPPRPPHRSWRKRWTGE
jgi:hypothetical protein